MKTKLKNILIVGGGFSGMAAAIQLRKSNVDVDIAEIDPGWRSYGAGISLGGATIRAFKTLGIADEFVRQGHGSDGIDLCSSSGAVLAQLPTPKLAGLDLPGGGAIMRPVLAKIMADATRAAGANVKLGCSFATLVQDADGVDVSFTNGEKKRYDLVIGADGLNSKTREAIFPEAPKPSYTGQCVWRMTLKRPPEINRPTMWMGTPTVKPGVNPISQTEMYLFVTEDRPTNDRLDPATFAPILANLLDRVPAPAVRAIKEQINPQSQIVYRPLEGLLLPRPWYRGRVVLVGDAVHATTPHLASGACIGIEDAIVLAQEVSQNTDVTLALEAFQNRRWERCRMVVENSLRMGQLEVSGGDKEEQAHLMKTSLMAMSAPI